MPFSDADAAEPEYDPPTDADSDVNDISLWDAAKPSEETMVSFDYFVH